MLQGLEHVRMEKQPQAAQATLFARGKVKHYLHCFHGLRRIIAYHSNVNSSESIIVYPHVACCLCAFCVRVQVRDAARGTKGSERSLRSLRSTLKTGSEVTLCTLSDLNSTRFGMAWHHLISQISSAF